jgi:hypothetical protein
MIPEGKTTQSTKTQTWSEDVRHQNIVLVSCGDNFSPRVSELHSYNLELFFRMLCHSFPKALCAVISTLHASYNSSV